MSENDLIDGIKNNTITSLNVTLEITHAGIKINNAYYESESLSQDYLSLMQPFNKPLIKNHDTYEEPIGRVKNSEYGQSIILDNHDAIFTTFVVTDTEAMLKFADGRYQTVSIGATCGHIKCDVCRRTILKDGVLDFCGHWRGNTYKGVLATWTMTKLDYREVSVVNDPADKFAQVIKIEANNGGKSKVNNSTNNQQASTIDGILNNSHENNQTPGAQDNNKVPDNSVQNNQNTGENTPNGTNENAPTINVKDSQEYKELEAKYNEVLNKNNELQTSLNSVNIDLQNSANNLNSKNSEIKELSDKLRSLAEMNLSLLKDKLILLNPAITLDSLNTKTAVEVNNMINDAVNKQQEDERNRSKVQSPGLSIDDSDNTKEDSYSQRVKDYRQAQDELANIWNNGR